MGDIFLIIIYLSIVADHVTDRRLSSVVIDAVGLLEFTTCIAALINYDKLSIQSYLTLGDLMEKHSRCYPVKHFFFVHISICFDGVKLSSLSSPSSDSSDHSLLTSLALLFTHNMAKESLSY